MISELEEEQFLIELASLNAIAAYRKPILLHLVSERYKRFRRFYFRIFLRVSNSLTLNHPKSICIPLLFRKAARPASPHHQLLPFPHLVAAGRAVVKRFSSFGVEVRRAAAFVATALNAQPPPPDGQISAFADAPPKSSCSFVPARQTPFAAR